VFGTSAFVKVLQSGLKQFLCVSARWLASGDGGLNCCPGAPVWTELISLCQCKVTCFWWQVPQLLSRCCSLDWTNFFVSVQGALLLVVGASAVVQVLQSGQNYFLYQCKVTCFWWWVPQLLSRCCILYWNNFFVSVQGDLLQLFSRCCSLDWTNFSVSVQVELRTSGTIDHMDLFN
jgi:hypothetical protein